MPVLKVVLRSSSGSPGGWKSIRCNGNSLGKGLELCFLVGWATRTRKPVGHTGRSLDSILEEMGSH